MKAFLLAGGLGTRLRPLTDNAPKCLLPIKGIPLLQIWFDICRRFNIDDILINVHSNGDVVRHFIAENRGDLRVLLFEEATLLGSAGTIWANRDWVKEEDAFWILYADVLTTVNLHQMLAFHNREGQTATVGVYEVPDPSRCGIVQVDGKNLVTGFVEKPSEPTGNLAFSGLLIATPALLDVFPDKIPADLGFDVLPKMTGRMSAYRISDLIIDIGTLDTYRAAQQMWSDRAQAQRG